MKVDFLIIGGGYFGCSIAYHLAKTGAKTLLIEANELFSGASGANFGDVQVQDCEPGTSMELTLAGIEGIRSFREELQMDFGYRDRGALTLATTEFQMEAVKKRYAMKKSWGLDIKYLEGKEINAIEPNMAEGVPLAATYYMQGQLYPFFYMKALITRGKEAGLVVMEHSKAARLLMQGNTCTGAVLSSGEEIEAKDTILCAAGGTRELLLDIGWDAPVHNIKSEAMITEAIQPFLRTAMASASFFADAHSPEHAAVALCADQTIHGNIILSETTKPAHLYDPIYEETLSVEHCEQLPKLALELYPALKDVNVLRTWTTQSPSTPSRLPLFGPMEVPGLFLAAGFKSAAVMTRIVGQVTRDILMGKQVRYDLSEFISQVKRI